MGIRTHFIYTQAKNGGFGVLGNGITRILESSSYFDLTGVGVDQIPKKEPEIIFTYGTPDLIDFCRELRRKKRWNDFKHIHYFVWESSKIPPDFITNFCYADLLLTAADYTRKAAAYSGLKNCKVWHHGIDDRFQYIEKDYSKGTFVFLHHNAYEYRKGTEFVIEAFTKEFSLDEDVKLILKGRERRLGAWLAPKISPFTAEQLEMKRINPELFKQTYLKIDHPQIEEIMGHVSDEEMVRINSEAHCFVFPAKGEGWGLPPFEAMAMGIVPIVPSYSCFGEWFNPDTMLEVKEGGYTNTEPRYTGYMYHPSIRQIRKQMRWAYENRDKLEDMGKRGSEYIHREYNWNKIHDELVEIVKTNKWKRSKRQRY